MEVGGGSLDSWGKLIPKSKDPSLIQLCPDQLSGMEQSLPLSGPQNPGGDRGHGLYDVYSGL